MATEQIPASKYVVAGQTALTGWQVISETTGFQEDTEDKATAAGQFNSKITYSRRPTKQLVLEANHGTTTTTYDSGGTIVYGGVTYIINSVSRVNTRGAVQVTLDLVSSVDSLA